MLAKSMNKMEREIIADRAHEPQNPPTATYPRQKPKIAPKIPKYGALLKRNRAVESQSYVRNSCIVSARNVIMSEIATIKKEQLMTMKNAISANVQTVSCVSENMEPSESTSRLCITSISPSLNLND